MLSNFVRFRMEGLLFFSWRHVSIRSADKTIFNSGDTSPREKDISTRSTVRHRSQCRTLHPIPFFRYRLLAIHSSLVPSRPQKRDERKKQNALCFVFSLSGTLTSLSPFFVLLRRSSRFVPCLRGKKNSLQTVQAQVEGNAHV